MAMEGMDIDAVASTGSQLKAQSHEIDRAASSVSALLTHLSTLWVGADAQEFENQWRQQYLPRLTAAAEAVQGLGQSAMNNVAAQQDASSASGGGQSVGSNAPANGGDLTVPGKHGPVDAPQELLGFDPFPVLDL